MHNDSVSKRSQKACCYTQQHTFKRGVRVQYEVRKVKANHKPENDAFLRNNY